MIKTETEQDTYLNGLNFCIKDFSNSSLKYAKYKDNEFKVFLKDFETDINDYLTDLNENIFNEIINDFSNYQRIQNLNFKNKMDIKQLKTFLNSMTFKLNSEFIKNNIAYDLNPNILKNFTIKLYLCFYDLINDEMKTALNDIVKHGTEDF